MSASRMPTLRPRSRGPSARLTAVVDLPTQPLPDATGMIEATPGMPAGDGAPPSRGRAVACGICGRRCGAVPPTPLARSAVSATSTDLTPGTARLAASARPRTVSHSFTAPASTLMEKNTLPSVTTTSDSVPVSVSGWPCGLATLARAVRTSSLRLAMVTYIGPLPERSTRAPPRLTACRQPGHDQFRIMEETMAKVAFVGLGVMGYPMAGHLTTKGGHEVTVYNRTAAKAEKWVAQYGGKSAPTPKAAAPGPDFVMVCVGNDNDLRQVMLGDDGVFAGTAKGAIVVDHTTAPAAIARELATEAHKRGF